MTVNKRELIYLVLSLILLAVAGVTYLTFGNRHQQVAQKPSVKRVAKTSSSSSSQNAQVNAIKKKLDDLEKNPSQEAIDKLKAEVDQLGDAKSKDAFKTRLAKIESELKKLTAAEEAVALAESTGFSENIDAAQEAINGLSLASKKAELQERLTALANQLAQQNISTVPEVPVTPAEETNTGLVETIDNTPPAPVVVPNEETIVVPVEPVLIPEESSEPVVETVVVDQ